MRWLLLALALVPPHFGGTSPRVADEYGPRAPAAIPARGAVATLILSSRSVPRRNRPVAMMRMPYGPLSKCRSSPLLRATCPRLIPRIPGWNTYPRYGNPVTATFGIERGGELPATPELNRPPRMLHLELTAAATRRARMALGFAWPRAAGVRPRNGLVRTPRKQPVPLRSAVWGGRHGRLLLAPPFPTGGSQGNHLIFRWRAGTRTYFLGLHAWEPFSETVAVLRRIVGSIP